jgi:tetratricopeptide (TPR) repeat protein
MEKQEWQRAIDGFKVGLIKNETHPQSYGNMGLCYAQLGQKEEALSAFDKALKIDPTYEPAIVNRAAVESLEEGEKLGSSKLDSIDYYKDFSLKKRSFAQYIYQKLVKGNALK